MREALMISQEDMEELPEQESMEEILEAHKSSGLLDGAEDGYFPFGARPGDGITDDDLGHVCDTMASVIRAKAIHGLETAFSGEYFDICALHSIIGPGYNPARGVLGLLHCKHFTDMPMDVRIVLYRAAIQCVQQDGHDVSFADFPFPEHLADFRPLQNERNPINPDEPSWREKVISDIAQKSMPAADSIVNKPWTISRTINKENLLMLVSFFAIAIIASLAITYGDRSSPGSPVMIQQPPTAPVAHNSLPRVRKDPAIQGANQ